MITTSPTANRKSAKSEPKRIPAQFVVLRCLRTGRVAVATLSRSEFIALIGRLERSNTARIRCGQALFVGDTGTNNTCEVLGKARTMGNVAIVAVRSSPATMG